MDIKQRAQRGQCPHVTKRILLPPAFNVQYRIWASQQFGPFPKASTIMRNLDMKNKEAMTESRLPSQTEYSTSENPLITTKNKWNTLVHGQPSTQTERLANQRCVCVCDLVFNIPLYAAHTGYDSGSAEGGGASFLPPFFSIKHPGRPALPVIVTHKFQ